MSKYHRGDFCSRASFDPIQEITSDALARRLGPGITSQDPVVEKLVDGSIRFFQDQPAFEEILKSRFFRDIVIERDLFAQTCWSNDRVIRVFQCPHGSNLGTGHQDIGDFNSRFKELPFAGHFDELQFGGNPSSCDRCCSGSETRGLF